MNKKIKTTFTLLSLFSFFLIGIQSLHAHCQIPCGIYGDDTRFVLLLENVTTIKKSIAQIKEEGKKGNHNQVVRWVNNKEHHADEIKTIACEYFLAQRIKEGQPKYEEKLKLLHAIIVYSMKCKQSLDEKNAATLEKKIKDFQKIYSK